MSAELVESVLSDLCGGNMSRNPELAAEALDCFDLNAFPGGFWFNFGGCVHMF